MINKPVVINIKDRFCKDDCIYITDLLDNVICKVPHDTENYSVVADRINTCLNSMVGIEDPKKFRETWEAIKGLELDQAANYKTQRDNLVCALSDLIALKKHKDTVGKDHHYLSLQPEAWLHAADLINSIMQYDNDLKERNNG